MINDVRGTFNKLRPPTSYMSFLPRRVAQTGQTATGEIHKVNWTVAYLILDYSWELSRLRLGILRHRVHPHSLSLVSSGYPLPYSHSIPHPTNLTNFDIPQ